jgi:hypothetical protein
VIDTPRGLHRAGIQKKTTEGDNVLSSDAMMFACRGNKAVERFGNLPPKRLLKRMARRIDPRNIKKGSHLIIEPV